VTCHILLAQLVDKSPHTSHTVTLQDEEEEEEEEEEKEEEDA
jgi:hypothetical protein